MAAYFVLFWLSYFDRSPDAIFTSFIISGVGVCFQLCSIFKIILKNRDMFIDMLTLFYITKYLSIYRYDTFSPNQTYYFT